MADTDSPGRPDSALPQALVFSAPPVPTLGPVSLVFGAADAAPAPVLPGTHLVFSRPPVPTPGPVRLVFGDEDDAPAPAIPDATLQAAGTVTGLRLHIGMGVGTILQSTGTVTGLRLQVGLRAGVRVVSSAHITALRLHFAARYDINVARPTVGRTHAAWQDAAPLQHTAASAWQQSAAMPMGTASHWQDADAVAASLRALWHDTQKVQRTVRSLFEQAERLPGTPARSSYQEAQRLRSDTSARFQEALRLPGAPLVGQFQEAYRDRQARVGNHFQVADKLAVQIASGMGIAVRLPLGFGGRFQQAWPPRPGQWQRPGPQVPEPCYTPTLPARLVFSDPHDASLPARLVFVCERHSPPGPEPHPGTVTVPIRRVYMLLNSASLRRVDGNIPLPTFSLTMSLDVGSWTWGFSASLPARALSDLQPSSYGDPVELEALVNGVPYRFLAESISRERSFNDEGLRVSGRGLSAVLDTPYATTQNFTNASALTARQIVENVLTDNGVSIGWGVDWQMVDWSVPAGVWSHNGSYIDAVNNVARAAGGYVQPHASAQTLRLANLYPTAPWEWAATLPDFELPADVMVQESIAWKENARYDRVYVSGASDGGVAGMVTRAGTAGGVVAPMVVDPLITHVDAVRQRGLSVLATAGRQAMVGLSLPVLAETGVIVPGKMVRYVDGGVTRTGITRGVQVTVDMPEITQRIEVETYA